MYVALLVMTVVIYALVCLVYLRHPAASWFHPLTIYLGFHGLVFVVRPILSWYYGFTLIYHVYLFAPDDYAKEMTLVVVNVGLICFAFASLHWGNARLVFRPDRAAARAPAALAPSLWLISVPLFLIIAYSLRQIWGLHVSGEGMDADAATGTFVNTTGNGYSQFAYVMAATLLPLLAWTGRFRIWWLGAIGVAVLLLAGSGIRGPIISMLVCAATLYLYMQGRRVPDWRIVAVTLGAVLVFNAIGADRGQQARELIGVESGTAGSGPQALAPMEGMDLGNLEFVEYLVDKVPRQTRTYDYFLDNLQVFTEPIPRVLWHDKPIGPPIRMLRLFDYGFPIGMTPSLPGEGWMQYGLIGVAIWCGLCGAACGAIYNRFARGAQTPVEVAFYAAFLATLIVFYRDGALVSLLRQGIFFVVPPALWWLAARYTGAASVEEVRLGDAIMARRARRAAATGSRSVPEAAQGARPGAMDGMMPAAAADARSRTPDLAQLPRSRRHPRRPLPRV